MLSGRIPLFDDVDKGIRKTDSLGTELFFILTDVEIRRLLAVSTFWDDVVARTPFGIPDVSEWHTLDARYWLQPSAMPMLVRPVFYLFRQHLAQLLRLLLQPMLQTLKRALVALLATTRSFAIARPGTSSNVVFSPRPICMESVISLIRL
jgi:hypothetical protein